MELSLFHVVIQCVPSNRFLLAYAVLGYAGFPEKMAILSIFISGL